MDYEKKYKEALERAENIYNEIAIPSATTKGICTYIFPELKESEDEKMRKDLINYFNGAALEHREEEVLAWLEKQGTSYTKRDVDDAYLEGVTDTKNEIDKQYEANYQIRKDIATFIFNYKGDIKDRAKWMDYLGIKVSFTEKQGEQKPAEWSEEDEDKMQIIINIIKDSDPDWEELINWLKSLRPQNTWKPSEEQIRILELAIDYWKPNDASVTTPLYNLLKQLKKLKG